MVVVPGQEIPEYLDETIEFTDLTLVLMGMSDPAY